MSNRFTNAAAALFGGGKQLPDVPVPTNTTSAYGQAFKAGYTPRIDDALTYALLKDPAENSVVKACLRYFYNAVAMGEPVVRLLTPDVRPRTNVEGDEIVVGHPLPVLLFRPQQGVDHTLFMKRIVRDLLVSGNSLVEIVVGPPPLRLPVELLYIPRSRWEYKKDQNTYYVWGKNNFTRRPIPPERILHLRYELDDDGGGVPPLTGGALRDVRQDNEVQNYSFAMLRNMGEPGAIIGPPDNADAGVGFDDSELNNFKNDVADKVGDRRGGLVVTNLPFKVHEFQSVLSRLGLDEVRIPSRAAICAVLGVPGEVALLNTGMDGSAWGDDAKQRRMEAQQHTVIPFLRNVAEQIDNQLLIPYYDGNIAQPSVYLDFVLPDLETDGAVRQEPADSDLPVTDDEEVNDNGDDSE